MKTSLKRVDPRACVGHRPVITIAAGMSSDTFVVISFCLLLLLLASAVSQTVTKHKQHEYDLDAVKEESRVEKAAVVSEKKTKQKNIFHSF